MTAPLKLPLAAIAVAMMTLAAPALMPAAAQVTGTQDASVAALDGDWEGVLDVQDTQLHLILQIKTADGKSEATLISVDQNGARLPVSSIARTEDGLTFAITPIDGKFVGKLSADSNTLDGKWTQHGNDLPLTLSRKAS